jgi:hypothetical protein
VFPSRTKNFVTSPFMSTAPPLSTVLMPASSNSCRMWTATNAPTSSVVVTGFGLLSSLFSPMASLFSRPSVKFPIVTDVVVICVVPSRRFDVGLHSSGMRSSNCGFDDATSDALSSKSEARTVRTMGCSDVQGLTDDLPLNWPRHQPRMDNSHNRQRQQAQ